MLAQQAPDLPPGNLWLGFAIVFISGVDIGLAMLLGLRDLYDGRRQRSFLLAAYGISRLAVVLLLYPIVGILLRDDTLRHVQVGVDSMVYLAGLTAYGLGVGYILNHYGQVRNALGRLVVAERRTEGMSRLKRKEDTDGHR